MSSQDWSGEAAVYVSIVNWKKGKYENIKMLYTLNQKGEQVLNIVNHISSSLSINVDVSNAKILKCNTTPKRCFQGQTHAYEGFLLKKKDAFKLIKKNKKNAEHLYPFLIGEELVGNINSQPERISIDFSDSEDVNALQQYPDLLDHLREKVLPRIEEKANIEIESLKKKGPRQNHLERWWQMWCVRKNLLLELQKLNKYIACARVTKRNIFEFISAEIRPNDKIVSNNNNNNNNNNNIIY